MFRHCTTWWIILSFLLYMLIPTTKFLTQNFCCGFNTNELCWLLYSGLSYFRMITKRIQIFLASERQIWKKDIRFLNKFSASLLSMYNMSVCLSLMWVMWPTICHFFMWFPLCQLAFFSPVDPAATYFQHYTSSFILFISSNMVLSFFDFLR